MVIHAPERHVDTPKRAQDRRETVISRWHANCMLQMYELVVFAVCLSLITYAWLTCSDDVVNG